MPRVRRKGRLRERRRLWQCSRFEGDRDENEACLPQAYDRVNNAVEKAAVKEDADWEDDPCFLQGLQYLCRKRQ